MHRQAVKQEAGEEVDDRGESHAAGQPPYRPFQQHGADERPVTLADGDELIENGERAVEKPVTDGNRGGDEHGPNGRRGKVRSEDNRKRVEAKLAGEVKADEGLNAIKGCVGDEDAQRESGGESGALGGVLSDGPPGLQWAEPPGKALPDHAGAARTVGEALVGPGGEGAEHQTQVHRRAVEGVIDAAEMTDPALGNLVDAGDVAFQNWAHGPGDADEQFGFETVPAGGAAQGLNFVERVNTEAALAVGNAEAALPADEEIRSPSADAVGQRVIFGLGIAPADDERAVSALGDEKKSGDVDGIELSVGVDGDGVGAAGLTGVGESGAEGVAFAAVMPMGDKDVKVAFTCPLSQ